MRRKAIKAVQTPIEEDESMAVFSWARMMVETGQEPRLKLLRCGFEGLRLPMGLRMKVKRQSVSKAWPDLLLAVPRWGIVHNCGLFIELKRRKGGVLSQEQKDMARLLMAQGYEVCVCKGADEAIATIKQYLGME